MNEGYIFADYIIVRKTAFVLGVHSEIGSRFVVWERKGEDYRLPHYFTDRLLAVKDMLERATQELEFCMENKARKEASHKETEEPCL